MRVVFEKPPLVEPLCDPSAAEEVEVDYTYMARAAAEALRLPAVRLRAEELQAILAVCTDFSYEMPRGVDEE